MLLFVFNSVWIKSMVMGHACVSLTSREQPASFVKKITNLAYSVIKVSITYNIVNSFNQNQGSLSNGNFTTCFNGIIATLYTLDSYCQVPF